MSTTVKTSDKFRKDLSGLVGTLPRPIDEALMYASTLENNNNSEEEEDPIPPGEKRKKQVKPGGNKSGHYKDILGQFFDTDQSSAQNKLNDLLDYISELEG